jgi:hypothetical protein
MYYSTTNDGPANGSNGVYPVDLAEKALFWQAS